MKRENQVRLGDYCEVFAGFAFKSRQFTDNREDIPLVKGENVGQGRILWSISKYWPRDMVDGLDRFRLRSGDVVLTMDRPWVPAGLKYAWIREHEPESLLVQRVARLRANRGLDQSFLRYVIGSEEFVGYIQNSTRGVNVPHISGRQIEDYRFHLPESPIQSRVVSILSAYDDLMENNRRRIALLEESARLLYREWFVRLRFPGHEHSRIIDGVPEGWHLKPLSELADYLSRGITPRYDDEGESLVINQKCIRNRLLDLTKARRQSREFDSMKQVQIGDVLINSTGEGTLGRVAQVKTPIPNCTVDSHVAILRPKPELSPYYFGMAVMKLEPYLSTKGRGATNQTELSRSTIGDSKIMLPPHSLVQEFESLIVPINGQVTILIQQNQKLKLARDLLLPRLMRGEIAV